MKNKSLLTDQQVARIMELVEFGGYIVSGRLEGFAAETQPRKRRFVGCRNGADFGASLPDPTQDLV